MARNATYDRYRGRCHSEVAERTGLQMCVLGHHIMANNFRYSGNTFFKNIRYVLPPISIDSKYGPSKQFPTMPTARLKLNFVVPRVALLLVGFQTPIGAIYTPWS
ncbi:hypothetical protein AVEN_90985-1 [Araneus ventricosus]|uniref:Uncharacterized protein n=1 Tax=Araneus ventricosus TaxID=182803 RepID=A0A4Y2TZP8_ARAVE|nr:hypothetical protein AVEN_90985-1 [Araneus ventricosus]